MFVADTHLHQCVFSGFYVPLLLKISDKSHPVPAQFSRLYWWDLSNRIGINLKIGILNLKNNNCYCSGWDLVLEIKSYVLLSILKHVSPFFMTQRQIVLMLNIRIILILVERWFEGGFRAMTIKALTKELPLILSILSTLICHNSCTSQMLHNKVWINTVIGLLCFLVFLCIMLQNRNFIIDNAGHPVRHWIFPLRLYLVFAEIEIVFWYCFNFLLFDCFDSIFFDRWYDKG